MMFAGTSAPEQQRLSRSETLERIHNMRAHLLLSRSNEFVAPWHDVVDDIDRKLQQLAKLVQVERTVSPERPTFEQEAVHIAFRLGIGRHGPAQVLARLLQTPGVMVSATELALELDLSRSTILVYLTFLRQHLEEAGFRGVIQTLRSRGYIIQQEDAERLMDFISGGEPPIAFGARETPELTN